MIFLSMEKGRIIHISNTEDSIWFRLKPGENIMEHLDTVLDIYSATENGHPDAPVKNSYSSWLKKGPTELVLDRPDFFAYVIFTKDQLNLILRRVKKFEEIRDKVMEHFEFRDVMKHGLTDEEFKVLWQVEEGMTDSKQISGILGMLKAKVEEILNRLFSAGLIKTEHKVDTYYKEEYVEAQVTDKAKEFFEKFKDKIPNQ